MEKRIVFKFGTNVLRNSEGVLDENRIKGFAKSIAEIKKNGSDVLVITSGAVGLGAKALGIDPRDKSKDSLFNKQACASVGQSHLMKFWEDAFHEFGIIVGQILLTEDDFSTRKRYLNLRNTLNRLLECGVIPVINQNDVVSTSELSNVCFSDNDKLSALVASKLDADLLVILSDIDGLFDKNPKEHADAVHIKTVEEITPEIEALATGASKGGTGGMITKIQASKVAVNSGAMAVILNGKKEGIIDDFFLGKDVGTKFLKNHKIMSSKARWIAYATNIEGGVKINSGAKIALIENNKSLLPIGVIEVQGEFQAGDVITISDEEDREFARGVANYSSEEARKIVGVHSDEIQSILDKKISDDIISKDNLVILWVF